ncbi:MAG: hypothetical protein MAG794_01261 [Gammaproteobacteria bacterium]|nr:hypothetical protein [Gammaproteobacteria bacterium]
MFGKLLLSIFGGDFTAGYTSLTILAAGQLFNALTGSVGSTMMMTGHQQPAAWLMIQAALLNGVLNLLLIPHFGIEGAAFATAVATVAWNIRLYHFIRHEIGLDTSLVILFTRKRND